MKWLNFKIIALVFALHGIAHETSAMDLRPAYASCQSGGGMGSISAGTGWKYGSRQRWETEIFCGIVPKHDSSSAKATFAIKENFSPWQIRLNGHLTLEPLTSSLYFTTIINKNFWVRQPDRYPSGYYSLSTKIRTNIALGQRIKLKLPGQSGIPDSISAYYEIGTCDIYALSSAGNKEIKFHERLQLCLGVRIDFRK